MGKWASVKIAAICFITAMKRISMQSFNNNVNVQFVPQVMLTQVADNCSVGETSSFNDRIIAIMETQSNALFVYMSSSCNP